MGGKSNKPARKAIQSVSSREGRARPPVEMARQAIPVWPGVAIALLCTLIYFLIGTGGTLTLRTSPFMHHNLTANAWLHGRLYATEEDLARAFLLKGLKNAGRSVANDAPLATLKEEFRKVCEITVQRRAQQAGVRLTPEQVRAGVAQLMTDTKHDWLTLPNEPHKYYAYWPPTTAALMLPFVLIGGPAVSDVLADNLVGGMTVLFIYLMLRALAAYWPRLRTSFCVLMSLAYGLGTVHMWLASLGQVWFLEQVTATLCLVVAVWMAVNAIQRPAWIVGAGLFLGLGYLGRFTIVGAAPFFAVTLWIAVRGRENAARQYLRWGSLFVLMVALCISFHMWFNWARFGDPLDSGQAHLADKGGNPRFSADFKANGTLSFFFLPRNTFFYFLNPRMGPSFGTSFLGGRTHPTKGGQSFDPDGNGLFFVSPFMVYLWLAWRRKSDTPLRPAWLGPAVFLAFTAAQVLLAWDYSGNQLRWPDRNLGVRVETALFVILAVALLVRCVLERDGLLLAALAGAVPGVGAMLLFYGTGFYTFGPRYLLDTMPFLLLLVAFGMRGRISWTGAVLVFMSIGVNAWGTYRFRLEQF